MMILVCIYRLERPDEKAVGKFLYLQRVLYLVVSMRCFADTSGALSES